MTKRTYKVAKAYGVFVPLIALAFIFISIHYSPWFSFTGNWLSDLAGLPGETPIWTAKGAVSLYFNVGLILAGVAGVVFAFELRKLQMFQTRLGRVSVSLLALVAFALGFLGVLPQTTGLIHYLVAVTFFLLVPLALISLGLVLKNSNEKKLGWSAILLGVVSLSSLILLKLVSRPFGSNAIAELFPIVAISLFIALYSARFLST